MIGTGNKMTEIENCLNSINKLEKLVSSLEDEISRLKRGDYIWRQSYQRHFLYQLDQRDGL